MFDTGAIYHYPERKGIKRGDSVYELRHDRYESAWWNLVHWVWCWLRWRPHMEHRGKDGSILFRRWWLLRLGSRNQGGWGLSLYLHHFGANRVDFALHNHPRLAIRFVLRGSYTELVRLGYAGIKHTQTLTPFSLWWTALVMPHWVWHRITHVKPGTWTLFLMVGKFRGWRSDEGEVR